MIQIEKDGTIFKNGIIVKGWNQNGYRMIHIGNKKYYVHILLAKKFIPNPLKLECVNHKNGIKNDNRLENLEWSTKRKNCEHARLNGLATQQQQNIKDITFEEYINIFKLRKEGLSFRQIETITGLNHRRVNAIFNGDRYKDFKKIKEDKYGWL